MLGSCVAADNRKKKLNMARQKFPIDLSLFTEPPGEGGKPVVSPQILLAAHRFLLAEVEPFKVLADKVLLRLLKQDVVQVLKHDESKEHLIYRKNRISDHFVLILEVRLHVLTLNCAVNNLIKACLLAAAVVALIA